MQEIHLVGINHKTSKVSDRERFIVDDSNLIYLNDFLISKLDKKISGFFGLSTCNRTEIYFYGDKGIEDDVLKLTKEALNISDIPDKNFYKDKKIIIFGGGDSALDWTVELSKIASHVTLVHRRDEFKAANHTVNLMKQLVKEGQVDLITKNQISDVKGSDRVEKAIIKDNDGNEKIIDCDEILIFYGLKMELGPINDWGLNLNEKQIEVNTENFETNLSGVFAMGDISYYPGKLKLILSGFHEAALAAQKAFIRARPDETLTFRYTTSSSDIQKKLGVK